MAKHCLLFLLLSGLLLTACSVYLSPGALVVQIDASGVTWGYPTDAITTPTREVESSSTPASPTPTEVVTFPSPIPLVAMVNASTDRYRVRQCPDTDCAHLGWILPGEVVEVDMYSSTADWLQVFRGGEWAGWVWRAPFEFWNG